MERLTSAVSPAAVLGVVFVLLAIANVSSILSATGRSRDETSRERLIRIHRIGGYAFVGLFCAMTYFMALRLEGVSGFLNDRAGVGLVVEAEGPFGRFTFDERENERVVLIAGGSGITPILSILRYIDDCSLDTPATLVYRVRTRSDIIFEAELERLKSRLRNFRALHLVSRPDEDWRGPSGRITRDLVSAHTEGLVSSTFFVCGPQPFMEAVQQDNAAPV